MGSDISLFVEYRQPGSTVWHCMGSRFTMPRDYELFTLLMDGFRGKTDHAAIPMRDTPDNVSEWARSANTGYSGTWCSMQEFRCALSEFESRHDLSWLGSDYHPSRIRIYDAAALAARGGNEVRLVYWFD